MARTKRNAMLIEEARSKIRTTQLVNRLFNHGLGKVKMSATQVQAINILLKKVIPDLAVLRHEGGDPSAPMVFNILNRPPKEEK